jgi:hypothetical protein
MISDNRKREMEENSMDQISPVSHPSEGVSSPKDVESTDKQGDTVMEPANGESHEKGNSFKSNKETLSCRAEEAIDSFEKGDLAQEDQDKNCVHDPDSLKEDPKTQKQLLKVEDSAKKEKNRSGQHRNGEF